METSQALTRAQRKWETAWLWASQEFQGPEPEGPGWHGSLSLRIITFYGSLSCSWGFDLRDSPPYRIAKKGKLWVHSERFKATGSHVHPPACISCLYPSLCLLAYPEQNQGNINLSGGQVFILSIPWTQTRFHGPVFSLHYMIQLCFYSKRI